jgi:hypothetical protein
LTNGSKLRIAFAVGAWLVALLVVMAVMVLFTGCTAAQRQAAIARHEAACEPALALIEQLTQVATKNGVDPVTAARVLCGAPEAARKVVETVEAAK